MRTIQGWIALPAEMEPSEFKRVVVEVRDVTHIDAPSLVVAQQVYENMSLQPGHRIPFELVAPEAPLGHTLALRVHASLSGDSNIRSGDLLTTARQRVADKGDQKECKVIVHKA